MKFAAGHKLGDELALNPKRTLQGRDLEPLATRTKFKGKYISTGVDLIGITNSIGIKLPRDIRRGTNGRQDYREGMLNWNFKRQRQTSNTWVW